MCCSYEWWWQNHLVNSRLVYNEGLTRAVDFLFLNTFDFNVTTK